MAACAPFDPFGSYITGVTDLVDCHVRALGEDGYRALGAGSPVGLAMTGLLTIYIAIIGYRMMLGNIPSVREGVVAAVKIGLVLALATQWPSFQTVVYNLAIDGPSQLAARVTASSGLGDSNVTALSDRLQTVYTALRGSDPALEPNRRPAPAPPGARPVPTPDGLTTRSVTNGVAIPTDATTKRAAQLVLITSLAGLLSVRIAAALLLALGPIFIACLLFGAMRGLFEGWVRALAGTALGAMAVPVLFLFELAILEPQISALAAAAVANSPVPALPGEVLATIWVFAIAQLATILIVVRAAAGFRIPDALWQGTIPARSSTVQNTMNTTSQSSSPTVSVNERSRAVNIADAVMTSERRERQASASAQTLDERRTTTTVRAGSSDPIAPIPLGQNYRRANPARRSASAVRRDALI